MSNLETLKEQHPAIQAMYDIAQRDGNKALPEELAVAALVTALQQHEATIAELKRELGPIRYDWEGAHDRLDALGILMGTPSLGEHLHKRLDALIADRESLRSDLAAAQATIQQQARELEALGGAPMVDRLVAVAGPETQRIAGWLKGESHEQAQADEQAGIHADYPLSETLFVLGDLMSALARIHSARAQQAEAKKEG